MKKFLKIFLAFFILPALWFFCSKFSWLQKLENYTIRLRYYIRGNIDEQKLAQKLGKDTPNIVCVRISDSSLKYLGEAPIPMSYYVKAMYALKKYAKNPIFATDIFFGEKQYSALVDPQKVKNDSILCNYYFSQLKTCIIGGWFNCNKEANQIFLKNEYPLPLIKEGFVDFQKIKDPILPSSNVIGSTASIGMLNVSVSTNAEDIVRWIPLYARTQQGIFYNIGIEALHQFLNPNGTMDIYGDDSSLEKYEGQHVILLLDKDVAVVKRIPLFERQLLEINWFSSWEQ
ncbi:MAG: CHASE2 domain-containing protein, partial [bacterium]